MGQANAPGNMQHARVYIVEESDVKNAPNMITGTTYISNKLTCILINPGATFSFMSYAFAMHNNLKSCYRIDYVIMSMPMGTSVICESVIKDVSVRLGEAGMKWNFIPLLINEFDVILDMDGLSQYRAKVNY